MSDPVFTLPRPESWKTKGLCNNRDQQFAAKEGVVVLNKKLCEAANVCSWCPVLRECQLFTLDERPDEGVWAGEVFTPSTRLTKLKRIAEAAGVEYVPAARGPVAECGTVGAYRRHLRENERPCNSCLSAQRECDARKNHHKAAS